MLFLPVMTQKIPNADEDVDADADADGNGSITSQDETLMEILGLPLPGIVGRADDYENDKNCHSERVQATSESSGRTTKSTLLFQHITLPKNVSRHFHDSKDCFAIVIPNLLSPKECQQLIALGGTGGFEYIRHAMHTAADGSQYRVELQNPNRHKLSVFQHSAWVDLLWERLRNTTLFTSQQSSIEVTTLSDFLRRESVPPPTGLNPRLRVLQYDAKDNDEFDPHFDATTRIGGRISLLTVLIYLNSGAGRDFEGGETYFLNAATATSNARIDSESFLDNSTDVTTISPREGSMVVFEHDLFHSGRPLDWGTKHVLRTDLLFDISETDWEQRAVKAAIAKDCNIEAPKGTSANHGIGGDQPTTVRGLVELFSRTSEWNTDQQDRLSRALEAMGMLDASIESFCTPGRFALQLMLQDTLHSCDGLGCRDERGSIRQFIDQAFTCLQHSRA